MVVGRPDSDVDRLADVLNGHVVFAVGNRALRGLDNAARVRCLRRCVTVWRFGDIVHALASLVERLRARQLGDGGVDRSAQVAGLVHHSHRCRTIGIELGDAQRGQIEMQPVEHTRTGIQGEP